ncbi:MAG: hypothetical protein KDK04_00520 [Candidatus Competibacteraceae bacterium]|nr:hypothetical protein [Candidatus Competibacteraceae bacterium]
MRVAITRSESDNHFEFYNGDSGSACAVAIIDIDSAEGQRLWHVLGTHRMPVKVAYTDHPRDVIEPDFALSKPLLNDELKAVMARVRQRLSELAPTMFSPLPSLEKPAVVNAMDTEPTGAEITLQDRVLLKRWPDFKQFAYTPSHVKIAVLISKKSRDIATLAAMSGLSVAETTRFINRCHALGYLVVEGAAPVVEREVRASRPAQTQALKQGFFQKIRSRLGI